MNIYKRKQFINQFEINYDNFQIEKCPNSKVPIRSEYNEEAGLIKAYLNKEHCNNCRYKKKCIKYDYDDQFNVIEIEKKKPTKRKCEQDEVIDKQLENLLKKQLELEIGSIDNLMKEQGKKYEDGIISYDGEYLVYDPLLGEKWYCHGHGKAYYEDATLEYEGDFIYGHPQGKGKYYYRNGQVKWEGIFEAIPGFGDIGLKLLMTAEGYVDRNGRIKYGKKFDVSGKLEYEGDFRLGIPEGNGKLYDDQQKIIFIGEFKNGKPIGRNKLNDNEPQGIEIYKGYETGVRKEYSKLTYIEILNEGINFRRLGKYELAKETYLYAIRIEPKRSVGYFNLGKILYILGEHEESVRSYQVAYELGDEQDVILNILEHMGHSLIDQENRSGKYEKVVSDYSRAMKSTYKFSYTAQFNRRVEYKDRCIEAAKKYLKEL